MLDDQFDHQIQQRIDQKTKPLGALGQLEKLAFQLAKIQSNRAGHFVERLSIDHPSIIIFAADHGIAEQGVSIAPSVVTQQMVSNFLQGGAAINCFCRVNSIDFSVVDCGLLTPVTVAQLTDKQTLLLSRLGQGTNDFSTGPAMTLEQVEQGLLSGRKIVDNKLSQGCELLMFGEMGIGNTSSASALLSANFAIDVDTSVGRGTGIDDNQWRLKRQLVKQGVERFLAVQSAASCVETVKQSLAELGGYEIVHLVGAFLQASERKIPVLVDGFIISVAAALACKIAPESKQFMIFAHTSEESAHRALLEQLEVRALLDLGLRLGEGTGAALAMPLVKCAAEFYNTMASFDSAGVTV